MKPISNMIREKRFQLKEDHPIVFEVDSSLGQRIQFRLENCALHGLGASMPFTSEVNGLTVGEIIPAAKLTWPGNEITLGRLVVRHAKQVDDKMYLGLSPIDTKVPVSGTMSAFFDKEFTDVLSPFDFELSHERFTLADFYQSEDSNVDILAKTKDFSVFYREWMNSDSFSYTNIREASKGTRVNLKRLRKGNRRDYLVMSSNDYLNLSDHPEVIEASKSALDEYGLGSTGAPVISGLTDLHIELEDEIARLFGKEAALLYNTGYTANLAAISSLVGMRDLALGDMLIHGSMSVGMNMSKGTKRFFRHNSVRHLEKVLKEMRSAHSGCLVLTEGVYSMDGDEAPLDEILNVCREHQARLYVDEAHSFGVVGPKGLGACEKYNILSDVDVIMGNLSKMGGSMGGFITGSQDLIYWLRATSYAYIQSTYLPPSVAAGSLAALRIFKSTPELLASLKKNIKHFKNGLQHLGFQIPHTHESAVFPVVIKDQKKLAIMKEVLYDHGIFVTPIVFPSVGKNNSRFRFTVSASHSISDLDYALSILEMAMLKADFKPTPNREKDIDLQAA